MCIRDSRYVGHVEADDPVVREHRVGGNFFEDAGVDPEVVAASDGGVGNLAAAEGFGNDPGAAGDQTDVDDVEAGPVGDSWAVAAFGVVVDVSGDELRDRCPGCLLYTSPSPRDRTRSRMPSSA